MSVSFLDRKLSVAPMMERTDRHFRRFLRLLAPRTLLYTEMVTAAAIVHGDKRRLLEYDPAEHPLALQLGGSDPQELRAAAMAGALHGYDEINLNVGCPSERVQSGRFGVCLMREPALVAECVSAMREAVAVPVTVKTRIGVDDQDHYEFLAHFVRRVAAAGCRTFIVHARKAWLSGVSPKDNRVLPPLRHDRVARLKEDFPQLEIILNGGLASVEQATRELARVDGVMIGREAYRQPYLMAQLDRAVYGDDQPQASREEIVHAYLPYLRRELARGARLHHLTRHLHGLYQGLPGASRWRRELTVRSTGEHADPQVLMHALAAVRTAHGLGLSGGGSRPKSVSTEAAM